MTKIIIIIAIFLVIAIALILLIRHEKKEIDTLSKKIREDEARIADLKRSLQIKSVIQETKKESEKEYQELHDSLISSDRSISDILQELRDKGSKRGH